MASIGKARTVLPDFFTELTQSRATHCPFAFEFPDNRLGRFVANYLLSDGSVEVVSDGATFRIAPLAHAGNGGALVDIHGRTSVPNLYACGECATGMHGANRIGGGMVLATQVFGHRAGAHAAHASTEQHIYMSGKTFTQLANKAHSNATSTAEKSEGIFIPPDTDWIMTRSNYLSKRTNIHNFGTKTRMHKLSKSCLCRASFDLIVQHYQSLS